MALTQIKAAGLAADLIDETKLADDSIDSEHYNDGSIDAAHLSSDSVSTAKIQDNAVTLAKMAGGTDGQIITYDASGDPVAVGPGTDGQVLTSTGAGSPPAFETISSSDTLSFRNLIINGSMQVAQRGTSSTTNGYTTVDRFSHFSGGGTATWSVGTETSGTVWEKGLRKYLRCTNTANATAAGNYREITYKIENQDLMDSGWNPASASSKLNLSFWVRASVAQTYYGRIRWMGDSADKNFVFSTGSLSADTWTQVSVSIPGLSGKTVNDGGSSADIASVFQLNWSPFQGTDGTASGTALNTWNAYASSSKYPDYTTTWGSTDAATFDITGVQLEVGDSATNFENRGYADELRRCQRYFWKQVADDPFGMAGYKSSSEIIGVKEFKVTMRDSPSLTGDSFEIRIDGGGRLTNGSGTLSVVQSRPDSCQYKLGGFSSLSSGDGAYSCRVNAGSCSFSAEL